ncbi:hypothetical protein KCP73_11225 [Salmonella enterica subsp. enterica]|nr:hypothetical protein KCP73_11225 [Salmonella enterica subsp. enterica]
MKTMVRCKVLSPGMIQFYRYDPGSAQRPISPAPASRHRLQCYNQRSRLVYPEPPRLADHDAVAGFRSRAKRLLCCVAQSRVGSYDTLSNRISFCQKAGFDASNNVNPTPQHFSSPDLLYALCCDAKRARKRSKVLRIKKIAYNPRGINLRIAGWRLALIRPAIARKTCRPMRSTRRKTTVQLFTHPVA